MIKTVEPFHKCQNISPISAVIFAGRNWDRNAKECQILWKKVSIQYMYGCLHICNRKVEYCWFMYPTKITANNWGKYFYACSSVSVGTDDGIYFC